MTLKHCCLRTSGFTILAVVATLGGADAALSTRSFGVTQDRSHGIQLAQSQPLYNYYNYPVYNYYNYPVEQVVRPGCYLPSDGCLSEYSAQN